MNCEFCNNIFSTQNNLNYHKKTAKYCLVIQGKKKDCKYACLGCSKTFARNCELLRHTENCAKNSELKYENKILELEEKLKKTKEECENEIAKQKKEFLELPGKSVKEK